MFESLTTLSLILVTWLAPTPVPPAAEIAPTALAAPACEGDDCGDVRPGADPVGLTETTTLCETEESCNEIRPGADPVG